MTVLYMHDSHHMYELIKSPQMVHIGYKIISMVQLVISMVHGAGL